MYTRLTSFRLSHTTNDKLRLGPNVTVSNGMVHASSQPGQTTLVAGRALVRIFCNFMLKTAGAGHCFNSLVLTNTGAPLFAPTRSSSSASADCGVTQSLRCPFLMARWVVWALSQTRAASLAASGLPGRI